MNSVLLRDTRIEPNFIRYKFFLLFKNLYLKQPVVA